MGIPTVSTSEPEGLLILDKPAGITSHDCVAEIRRLYHTKKVGHTGTLDPMATGVLPILLGRTAKAAEYLTAEDKYYCATLRLGMTTDTEDVTGNVLTESREIPTPRQVFEAVLGFAGPKMQIPPMYSALKVNGEKLCDLARRGVTVEREPRPIEIFSVSCEQLSETDYCLDVHCSKGTYIRTLCADIGAKLGCGGVMASLRRTGTGTCMLRQAVTLKELKKMTDEERLSFLCPTEKLFSNLPELVLPAFFERLTASGQAVQLRKLHTGNLFVSEGTLVRMRGETKGFYALGEIVSVPQEDGSTQQCVKCVKLFVL